MPQYLSPGVYVEEIPSAVQAIVGVGTSTAGFIGIFPDEIQVPVLNQYYNPLKKVTENIQVVPRVVKLIGVTLVDDVRPTEGSAGDAADAAAAAAEEAAEEADKAADDAAAKTAAAAAAAATDKTAGEARAAAAAAAAVAAAATAIAADDAAAIAAAEDATGAATGAEEAAQQATKAAADARAAADAAAAKAAAKAAAEKAKLAAAAVTTADQAAAACTIAKGGEVVTLEKAEIIVAAKTDRMLRKAEQLTIRNVPTGDADFSVSSEIELCTNFSDFRTKFGDFSNNANQNRLAHAVHGFFNNGGTRCFVGRVATVTELSGLLERFGAIDEIALMAAPGLTGELTEINPEQTIEELMAAAQNGASPEGPIVRDALVSHCANLKDRFALLDSDLDLEGDDFKELARGGDAVPPDSDYAAFYFPWIKVFDPVTKMVEPDGDGQIFAPPSGHMAGIYARTDTTRGVFKAPANEQVRGALGLRYQVGKALQDGLNPQGVNCIRDFNGTIKVWGARTIGGDANGEWRYINVRRTFLFLRESIEEGMQWAVFEPNDQALWAKITRNVIAFLTIQWRAGALFGATLAEAFYVKCDAETNPPELRELGQVVTEIGVAVVRPAEFVIFRISQWQPPKG